MNWDEELEKFKQNIDLRDYAANLGYVLDRRESWRGSAVMRFGNDKIVIKRHADGHYVYFSVRDEQDNGSIIDFIQHRKLLSLGNVRKELRTWIRQSSPSLPALLPLERTGKNRLAMEAAYRRMLDVSDHPYLLEDRRIPAPLLASERFAGRVRIDANRNAVFPHFDEEGLCGYELKNRNFTGFAPGGEKGLWFSRTWKGDRQLVFAESAIDALSFAVLFPASDARYASIGGQINPKQPGLIKAAVSKMEQGATITSATDNDLAGRLLTAMIAEVVRDTKRPDLVFKPCSPERDGVDWNDVLQDRSSFPAAL